MRDIEQTNNLINELKQIIDNAKQQVTQKVNSTITIAYWHIGKKINEDILQNKRAEYGKQIVKSLAKELVSQYGKSFEVRNLQRMMQFAELFPDFQIVSTASTQLSWSHFIELPLRLSGVFT